MADVLIGLGGNVGDVRANFARAIPLILARTNATLLARSSDYETPPWGGDAQQPPFVNACIRLETATAPEMLLSKLHEIESGFGRDRTAERRWGPRTLDLDLLAYDDVAIDEPALTVPHPRLFERAFVLVPLAEIAPNRSIGGRTAAAALKSLSTKGITRLPPL